MSTILAPGAAASASSSRAWAGANAVTQGWDEVADRTGKTCVSPIGAGQEVHDPVLDPYSAPCGSFGRGPCAEHHQFVLDQPRPRTEEAAGREHGRREHLIQQADGG